MTEDRLKEVFEELSFPATFSAEQTSDCFVVKLVAKEFGELDAVARQELVWDHLRKYLSEDELTWVWAITTSTPDEAEKLKIEPAEVAPEPIPEAVVEPRRPLYERLAGNREEPVEMAPDVHLTHLRKEAAEALARLEKANADFTARETAMQKRIDDLERRERHLETVEAERAKLERAHEDLSRERDELRERLPDVKTSHGAMNEALALACRTARVQRDEARRRVFEVEKELEALRIEAQAAKVEKKAAEDELQLERDVSVRLRGALREIAKNPMPAAHVKTHNPRKCDATVCVATRALQHQATQPLEIEREMAAKMLEAEKEAAIRAAEGRRGRVDELEEALRAASYSIEVILGLEVAPPEHQKTLEAALEAAGLVLGASGG